jgi:hypothetical protein
MRRTLAVLAAFALTATALSAEAAAPCRDAKGNFIKCPAPTAKPQAVHCKHDEGRFRFCGTPGTKPV